LYTDRFITFSKLSLSVPFVSALQLAWSKAIRHIFPYPRLEVV
jgi:hypothetical protein